MNNFPLSYEKASPSSDEGPWHILNEEVSLPVAVIQQRHLTNNIQWMQKFADHYNVKLAPHGKTTMATDVHWQQLREGSWGISLATTQQVLAAYYQGVKTFLMANQLIGKANCELLLPVLKDPEVRFYCFVDSAAQVKQLNNFFQPHRIRLNVLIEMGVQNGRCGVRSQAEGEALADIVAQLPSLELCGMGFYEGVIHSNDARMEIETFIDGVLATFHSIRPHFSLSRAPIITGAGSAWYDIVADKLSPLVSEGVDIVLRPGCYVAFDAGIYAEAQRQVESRSLVAASQATGLQNALQIWAYVQSVPEPALAVIGMGKRDIAFDAGLPVVERIWRPSVQQWLAVQGAPELTGIMDQHAMLHFMPDLDLQVGDMIQFASSHPCLTFDKWRKLAIVEENDIITHYIPTYF